MRYASVYRHFQDVEAFREEIERLRHRRGTRAERGSARAAARRDAAKTTTRASVNELQRLRRSRHAPRAGARGARAVQHASESARRRRAGARQRNRRRRLARTARRSPCRARSRCAPPANARAAPRPTSRSSPAVITAARRLASMCCWPPACGAWCTPSAIRTHASTAAGARLLREAGVTCESGLLEREAAALNAGFLMRMRHGPAVRAAQVGGESRRPHRAGQRREQVDHQRGGACRRAALARAERRGADQRRHRARR